LNRFLRIVGWEKYQHYKDRNPPWIKLHREILTSYTWTVLDEQSRLLAIVCMVLAADTGNRIPLDRDFIQRRGQFSSRPDVRKLVEVGFAEVFEDSAVNNGASKLIADARPETETEADTKQKKRASRLPDDWSPKQRHYELAAENGVVVEKELPKFRDYFLGNGTVKVDWDRTFNNWLRNAPRYGGRQYGREGPAKPHVTVQHQRAANNLAAVAAAFGGPGVVRSAGSNGSGQTPRLSSGNAEIVEGKIRKVH